MSHVSRIPAEGHGSAFRRPRTPRSGLSLPAIIGEHISGHIPSCARECRTSLAAAHRHNVTRLTSSYQLLAATAGLPNVDDSMQSNRKQSHTTHVACLALKFQLHVIGEALPACCLTSCQEARCQATYGSPEHLWHHGAPALSG